ncbi:hypothetical protein FS837_006070 [Tulasnella sp. UAMH 9824]|nr:hypothetical protein FS837_006070 [Tulasnella sp. UAMH 9824]
MTSLSQPSKEGIHRIQDILLHESVRSEAVNPDDLSFQRAYLPVLGYISSRWVLRSTLRRNINALYGLLHHSFEDVDRTLQSCIGSCMDKKSFSDSSASVSGLRVFCTVTKCLFEYATHFKNAVSQHACFSDLVTKLVEWSEVWALGVCSSPPQFNDPIADWSPDSKTIAIDRMKKSVDALYEVVARAEGSTLRPTPRKAEALEPGSENQILVDKLNMTYDGPGIHHTGGTPRHDNDDEEVARIQVVPTHGELTASEDPYLPANIPGARHHLPGDSMERLVDIQFRLLREELIAPIRASLLQVLDDFQKPPSSKTQLSTLLEKGGGLYRTQSGSDSVMFSMYTGVKFKNIDCDLKWGLAVDLEFDTPHGLARNPSAAKRAAYWESVGRKRLMQGGLIGLLWVSASQEVKFYIGAITSFPDDLRKSAVASPDTLALKVSFFDSEAEVRILNALHQRRPDEEGTKILIEAPIMFESIRPFLESLQSPERPPPSIPFARYLTHPDSGDLSNVEIDPPAYATPRFEFKLGCLFDSDQPVNLTLRPHDALSVENARDALKAHSRLDPSQADAMVNVLTSEVSLIQGPPGTGKSFTGVELLRVLISSGVRPVLLIAFTNHALDNIVTHVLQKGITKKIIRLGARSNDPTVSQYTLENILKTKPPSQADKAARQARQKVRNLQGSFTQLMSTVIAETADESQYQEYLQLHLPDHFNALYTPPSWIQQVFDQSKGWNKVAGHGYKSDGLLDFWRNGEDLKFITPPPVNEEGYLDEGTQATRARRSGRRFDALSVDGSEEEEDEDGALTEPEEEDWLARMADFFARHELEIPTIPVSARDLRRLHKDSNVWDMSLDERERISEHWNTCIRELAWDDQKEEFNHLKNRHAEARKTLAQVVDRSLMERLFNMGLPMSQLDVQRRMRPEIANLVRDKLYPALKDHELVQSPPKIRGMARDVFFLDHRHAEESGGDDSASKTNAQGKYTRTGDIVVLCAYLGQLAKVRKLLSNEVATVIDERDAVQLINHEDNDEAAEILVDSAEQVQVSKRILLRTVDNFQGEEGTIVILSLVRNSGDNPKAGRKIGFLKSTNRVNVALSRAREGLYILGNSEDLLASKSEMWSNVIDQLKRNDQIGPALPLSCSRHPNNVVPVSKPGQISIHAPDGQAAALRIATRD